MKTCPTCKKDLPNDAFRSNRARPDGLSRMCRACASLYESQRYARLSRAEKDRINERKAARRRRVAQRLFGYLREHPCVDCGEDDPIVLEFDHTNGDKKFNISDGQHRSFGWTRLHAEIEKCVVRCANCHRRKTAKELGWYSDLQGVAQPG